MIKKVKNSIIFRIGLTMSLIFALAIFSMLSSYLISEMADTDAEAVNLSGSLRMQSFKALNEINLTDNLQHKKNIVDATLAEFEKRLNNPVLKLGIVNNETSDLAKQYVLVSEQWRSSIKPMLHRSTSESIHINDLTNEVKHFVNQIDQLVFYYQKDAERKIKLLRLIQVFALFGTLALVYYTMTSLRRSVETPLMELTKAARRISNGDFLKPVKISSKDELGVLADTINTMSATLSEMYGRLEQRVKQKTFQLERSNDALQFLLNTSNDISANHADINYERLTDELSRITQINSIDLCLTTANGATPYLHVLTDLECRDAHCEPENCAQCVTGNPVTTSSPVRSFPLERDGVNYGVLTCRLQDNTRLEQ